MNKTIEQISMMETRLRHLEERAKQLQECEEALQEALHYIQEAESLCPDEIIFSHHAEMEIDENLGEVQKLMEESEEAVKLLETFTEIKKHSMEGKE